MLSGKKSNVTNHGFAQLILILISAAAEKQVLN